MIVLHECELRSRRSLLRCLLYIRVEAKRKKKNARCVYNEGYENANEREYSGEANGIITVAIFY